MASDCKINFVFSRRLSVGWPLALLLLPGLLAGCSRSRETAPALPDRGERVVSLAPSLTEIVCAVGAATQLVGRTSACDYPPDKIAAIPIVGGFGAPSLDLLLKIQPTLVLDVDLADAALGAAIDQAGLTRRRIACATVDDSPRAILQVGRLTHQDEQARALAEPIRARIAELRAAAAERQAAGRPGPLVFAEIWSDPLTTAGKRSFLSDLITLAGGRNLGDEVADKDYFTASDEWVITRNPEVIICLYMGKANKPDPNNPKLTATWRRLAARTGWAEIAAVKNHRVYGDLNNNVILRPGPRVLEGIAALRRCLEESQGAAPTAENPVPPK
jgi:iron complex transport system substrate-binding protein